MDSLCTFCSRIRFDLLGFHGSSFHPIEPPIDTEDGIDDGPPNLAWQDLGKISLSMILDCQGTCQCCEVVAQLIEDRLQSQDAIPKSLYDLAAANAMVLWDYRTEPGYRSQLPKWETIRLQFDLELPKTVVESLRINSGLKNFNLDPLGPNVFGVLQPADHTIKTMKDSMEANDDYEDKYGTPIVPLDNWGKGRLRPRVFDASIVNYWRDICRKQHGLDESSPCRQELAKMVVEPSGILLSDYLALRVIDVRKKCIVDLKPNSLGFQPRYYALSYVWGSRPFLTLNKSNESKLRKVGALSNKALPDTIADAMAVVMKFQGDYLWVDSLCILQDDEADRERFISRMGTIYRDADMTIIAFCGNDAYAGLPGVRRNKPRIDQQEINIQGISMLPVMMVTGWAETYNLGETPWTTRAWTFQETVLSRRRLVFGKEQVHFMCTEAVFSEDVIGPSFSPFVDGFSRLQLFGPSLSKIIRYTNSDLQSEFQDLVTTFTKRQLSQRRDRLDAFMGILKEIEKVGGPFFQGIPVACFSNAILWDRAFAWSGLADIAESSQQEERALQISELPSWSWVGWMYDIHFTKDFGGEPVNVCLRFYGYTPNEGLRELNFDGYENNKHKWGSLGSEESDSQPRGSLSKEFWDSERMQIVLEDIPISNHKIPLLCFWTSTATVCLRKVGTDTYFKTRTGTDVKLGLRIFVRPGEVKTVELIVLGDLSYDQRDDAGAVAVVAIRWDGGIAYREPFGLEQIKYSIWLEIGGLCWKKVIMS